MDNNILLLLYIYFILFIFVVMIIGNLSSGKLIDYTPYKSYDRNCRK